jgi:hypothetical protein
MAVSLFMPAAAYAGGAWPAVFTEWRAQASPGDEVQFVVQVTFSGVVPKEGECIVLLGGKQVEGAGCTWDTSGRFSGSFRLPPDTRTGLTDVSVCWPGCYDDPVDPSGARYWQLKAQLRVVLPPVEVPDVRCLTVKEAEARLKQAGLNFAITGDVGDVVTGQRPLPRELIPQNGQVTLVRQAVPVPNVVGSTYQKARSTLEQTCLAITAVAGITEGTVTSQDPGVGARVAGGSAVSVVMTGPPPPTTPPTTPPTSPPTTPPTTATTPPSPTPTPTTTLTPPEPPTTAPSTTPSPTSPPVVPTPVSPALASLPYVGSLLAFLTLWLLARALGRGINRHRESGWVGKHVTVTARPGPLASFETRPIDGPAMDHIITVAPVEVRRSTTVKEDSA